ncbi:Hypothetical protein FKW44_011800 [Caligus rogercresseyi]|uniref:Uncharacterized protein n=1 Tax=Caligus rogercresseyi TaxID=217165 RepID=A0A7T8K9Y1_CALRO|nr:Hypothetical protein FKW44_011800 [Caligus rogercresseyi]
MNPPDPDPTNTIPLPEEDGNEREKEPNDLHNGCEGGALNNNISVPSGIA